VLIGVDPSYRMLCVASSRPGQRARFVRARVERLPLVDGAVEVMTCAATVRHWADLGAGFAEVSRVLARGGVVVVSDFFPSRRRPLVSVFPRPAWVPRLVEAALHAAGLRLVTSRIVDGFGPVNEVRLIVAGKHR
jgi:ubiquinone/menaquinone biosynthesis C-methylase UbiE